MGNAQKVERECAEHRQNVEVTDCCCSDDKAIVSSFGIGARLGEGVAWVLAGSKRGGALSVEFFGGLIGV